MGLKELIKWMTGQQIHRIMLENPEKPTCPICGKQMRVKYYMRPNGNPGSTYVPDCDCVHKYGGNKDE